MAGTPSFSELIAMLKNFSPGDLIGSMEIAETADVLSELKGINDEQLRLCREINELFTKIIKEGTGDDIAVTVGSYADELAKFVSDDGGKEQAGEEEGSGFDESDYEVLISFIQEARDHLENIEEEILRLEDGNDPVVVNNIFRSMHTIKGVASFIGLHKIKSLSHSLETVLDKLRTNEIDIIPDLIDLLLAGSDTLSKMVHELDMKAHERGTGGSGGIDLDSALEIDSITEALDHIQKREAEEDVTPEMIDHFIAEAKTNLSRMEKILHDLEEDPVNHDLLNEAFERMHTIKGNAGFYGYDTIEQVSLNIETVLDQIRRGEQEYDESIIAVVFESIKAIQNALSEQGDAGIAGQAEADFGDIPLGEAMVEMGAVSRDAVVQALELQQRKLGEILVDEGKVQPAVVEKALSRQQKRDDRGAPGEPAAKRMDIRVDTEKLDKLFDLMGELITTEGMVIDNPELEQYDLDKFHLDAGNLSKITREMQEITMTIRMIPLDGLFNKMRRLVRDLSRKFGKNVNLEISGQETEMDRNVLEEISDPLVHIIRNAIDHGIEDEDVREKAGKEPAGRIRLNAKYEGNEIWISVRDDGKGLDREKILAKAKSSGLIDGDGAAMPDREVWPLIFEPGFSTVEEVSEISGRGVGMDVVKRNIEKLRGKVDISTEAGSGTEIVLRIPLTLAIIDGITVTVGDMMWTIPVSDIISFHKVDERQLTSTNKGEEVLNLRGDIYPIIKFWDLFSIDTEKKEVTEGIVIIVVSDNKQAALLVDEIIGNKQVVIKALPEEMGDMEGVSGCTIMGNGEVSLIVDTNALLQRALD